MLIVRLGALELREDKKVMSYVFELFKPVCKSCLVALTLQIVYNHHYKADCDDWTMLF